MRVDFIAKCRELENFVRYDGGMLYPGPFLVNLQKLVNRNHWCFFVFWSLIRSIC